MTAREDRFDGLLEDRDDVPMNVVGKAVFFLLVTYLILNRAIPDLMVVPIGISIRPYELVMMLIFGVWMVWMITEPHPFPMGLVGAVGLALVAAIAAGPFLNALNATPFMINGAQRGLIRLFLFLGLFLASYHMAYRLRYGMSLLGWVVGVTVAQALLGIYEFITKSPVTFMFDLSRSLGLQVDPKAIRDELTVVIERFSGELRATATAPHPIVLSAVIALAVMIAAVWIIYAQNKRHRTWLILSAVVLVASLPVPNSRTAFVMLAVAALPLFLLMVEQIPKLIPWSLALLGMMLVAFAISPATPRLLLDSVTRSDEDPNTQVRIERFSRVPELIEPRPVIGAGYLTHDVAVQLFDNAYNMAIIEFGILGMTLFLWWLAACLVRGWSAVSRAGPEEIVLPIVAVAAVIGLLAGGATFDAWTFDQFLPTSLVVLGVGVGRADVVLRRHRRFLREAASAPSEESPAPTAP